MSRGIAFPEPPNVPDDRRASGTVPIRYEDIAQDGRLVLEGIAPAIGEVVWRKLLAGSPVTRALREQKTVPILTRVVIEGEGGPFSTFQPLEASGTFALAHATNDAGEVERVMIDMWVEATLPIGRNYGPPPERAGERIRAGRFFGEHVLTRLFAPPDQRKVTSFAVDGAPMHGDRRAWVAAESVATLPEGAAPLEDTMRVDPTPIAFGLTHTDSNQHVNSLVYPRLFEDAALRRFAELGRLKPPVLSRYVEAAFRKPCFAGERYAIALRTFTLGDRIGAVGSFVSEADARTPETLARARAHCFVKMMFA
jgi:acyl-CoA thioesterase FadM